MTEKRSNITQIHQGATRAVQGPKCPNCGFQPAQVYATQTQFGRMIAAVFSCSACDAILSVSPIAMTEPDKPRIIVPGGQF
jgi:DNA-directed RNA polymerase subunit M/transcription elongation factor TFIIS